jgi:hypothetical protein
MAWVRVTAYALMWSVANNTGAVHLQLDNGSQGQIPVDSAQELAALADILRNWQEVGFDGTGQSLTTTLRPPGTS